MSSYKINTSQIRKLEFFIESIINFESIIERKNEKNQKDNGYSRLKNMEYYFLLDSLCSDSITEIEKRIIHEDYEARLSYQNYPTEEIFVYIEGYEDGLKIKKKERIFEGVPRDDKKDYNSYINYINNLQNKADEEILKKVSVKLGFTTRFLQISLEIIEIKLFLEEKYNIVEQFFLKNKI